MAEYPNRSDLRNPAQKLAATAAKGQAYGEAGKQMAAQQVVPMGAGPSAAPEPMQPVNRPQDMMAPIMNNRPSILPMSNPVIEELETLYRMYPNDDLEGLLSAIKYNGL
jgi:hypothetical protein